MPYLGCQLAHVGGIKGVPQGGHLIQHTSQRPYITLHSIALLHQVPGLQVAYRWCTGGLQVVYRWCTGGLQVVYRWFTGGL